MGEGTEGVQWAGERRMDHSGGSRRERREADGEERGEGGGFRPKYGELSEGVGGPFGRLTPFNAATSQQPLDCTPSKADAFKRDGD